MRLPVLDSPSLSSWAAIPCFPNMRVCRLVASLHHGWDDRMFPRRGCTHMWIRRPYMPVRDTVNGHKSYVFISRIPLPDYRLGLKRCQWWFFTPYYTRFLALLLLFSVLTDTTMTRCSRRSESKPCFRLPGSKGVYESSSAVTMYVHKQVGFSMGWWVRWYVRCPDLKHISVLDQLARNSHQSRAVQTIIFDPKAPRGQFRLLWVMKMSTMRGIEMVILTHNHSAHHCFRHQRTSQVGPKWTWLLDSMHQRKASIWLAL